LFVKYRSEKRGIFGKKEKIKKANPLITVLNPCLEFFAYYDDADRQETLRQILESEEQIQSATGLSAEQLQALR
jgi:hypothetical protein